VATCLPVFNANDASYHIVISLDVLYKACVSVRSLSVSWLFCVGEFFNAPLGNVYAEDEDDWDVDNKTFAFVDSDPDTKYFKYGVHSRFLTLY